MKKVLFAVVIALVAVGCASKKTAYQGDKEVTIPCTGAEYQSTSKVFRAHGMGYSNDMQIAKSKALINARTELATSISATLKRVADNYASSYQMGENEEAKSKFQDLARLVVNQELQGSVIICDKMMKTPGGQFRSYVVVELGGAELANKIANAVKDNDKLRIDYEYEKFKKVFEEEMSKME
ncbi:MAG TPA: hypothetical protein PK557_05215 [Paludibacteraceae bacterium]|nr:hypothetical protein [Paludibacteraceae bacterium]HPW96350.1 hypothetical protein [Paludibacteraceae bacterium]